MQTVRYTLHGDGPSDRALLPILTWVLRVTKQVERVVPQWADLGRLPRPPRGLSDRIRTALDIYPCDVLFVHRDSEGQAPQLRFAEIAEAVAEIGLSGSPLIVPVVPIRMSEAWLLTSEVAIRHAAGNPNGSAPLYLPPPKKLESLPDPKQILHESLQRASGLRGRQLQRFQVSRAYVRVGEFTDDFGPLHLLDSFRALVEEVARLQLAVR